MHLKEKIMEDRLVVLILLIGTCVNLYYGASRNLLSDWETMLPKILLMLVPYAMYLLILCMPSAKNEKRGAFIKKRKMRIILVFIFNFIVILALSNGTYQNIPQILAILFSMCICLFGSHLTRIKKSNEMWGLKTPWTGNSIEHLHQTNQFGGRLLNFVGIAAIISSFYIGPLFATCLILMAVLAIYAFSYYISKK